MNDFSKNNSIHPTAIIGENVKMGHSNTIGPFCVLAGDIQLGNNNDLGVGVVTNHKVVIGDNCKFYPYVSIGFAGEMGAKGDKLPEGKGVIIEDNVTIREFVNVHAPYWWENTFIGSGSYLMNKSYIAHDVQIGKNVMINAGVLLGGRAKIHDFANVGMGASVHQRSIIGESAMIGMNAVIKKNIPPFAVAAGVPAEILKFNSIGARRRGFSEKEIAEASIFLKSTIENEKDLPQNKITKLIKSFLETYPDVLRNFHG